MVLEKVQHGYETFFENSLQCIIRFRLALLSYIIHRASLSAIISGHNEKVLITIANLAEIEMNGGSYTEPAKPPEWRCKRRERRVLRSL